MNHPNRTPRPDGSAVQPQRARRPAGRQPSRRGDSEVQRVLAYLDSAPAVLVGRGFDLDLLDPGTADVPAAFLTDGTWIWPAAVVHYLRKHGMPPEPDLVAHIRANGFQVPRVDEQTQRAAEATITGARCRHR